MLAALAAGGVAAHWGLVVSIALAVVAIALSAPIWSRLPETLVRHVPA